MVDMHALIILLSGGMDTLFGQKLETRPSCNTPDLLGMYNDGVDELALLQARTQRETNHAQQSLQTTVEPSVQHRRQNNLKSKLRASLSDDVAEKRLRNLKDDACLDTTSVEKPSLGRLRSTRLNNSTDKSRTISNQRRSPSPPEYVTIPMLKSFY